MSSWLRAQGQQRVAALATQPRQVHAELTARAEQDRPQGRSLAACRSVRKTQSSQRGPELSRRSQSFLGGAADRPKPTAEAAQVVNDLR